MVREDSKYLYTAVSLPKKIMDAVEEYRNEHPEKQFRSNAEYVITAIREKLAREQIIFPKFAPNDRKGREKFLRQLEKSPPSVQDEFMRQFWGQQKYDEMKSGNVPFEKFVEENLAVVVDGQTGKIRKLERSPKQENDILVSINEQLIEIKNALGKKPKK